MLGSAHPNGSSSQSAKKADKNDADIKSVNAFVHDLRVDAINLFKLEQYMKESEIAKKVHLNVLVACSHGVFVVFA